MGKTLLTGGTGFIGSHLARALARRGDELRLAVRGGSRPDALEGLDFERVEADVADPAGLRRAMKGVDRVFHAAGLVSLRPADRGRLFDVNVTGTRNVLGEALRAGVERVVYTSSVAAVGPAKPGGTADEDQLFTAGELDIAYVNSKHEAEVEAMRLAAQGLGVVCVNPAFTFGPGDLRGGSTGLVRRFLLGRIPAYVDGGLNVVDVRDVARGHLLADRKGEVGRRYILGGRNFTWDRLFADLGRIAGLEPPVKVPAALALMAARGAALAGLPAPVTADEVSSAAQWWTYRNTRARKELGFRPRPHEETLEATVRWHLDRLGGPPGGGGGRRRLGLRLAGRAVRLASR